MLNKDTRPTNIEKHKLLFTFHWTPTMYLSILNRFAGMLVFFCLGFLLYVLGASLESEESFLEVKEMLASPLASFSLWVLVSAIYYHFIMGIKHLMMDLGVGETLESAKVALSITAVTIAIGIAYLAYYIFV